VQDVEKVQEQGQALEVLGFSELTRIEFLKLYQEYDIANAPERKKADMIDAILEDIYDLVFRPLDGDIRYNNLKSRLLPYKIDEVESVTKMLIKLNRLYGGVIKFNQFSDLTGINRYTIDLWSKANHISEYIVNLSDGGISDEYNNLYIINKGNGDIEYRGNNIHNIGKVNNKLSTLRFDVKKKMQQAMQDSNTNALSNDTMGQITRANNERELGKVYQPRNMIIQEQVKQEPRLTPSDVKRLYGIEGDIGLPEFPNVQ